MPKEMKPLVSAIIPNYNYARYVGEAVESALGQTYPNIEVIVVDDGSTDNSLEVLEKYRDRIKIIEQKNSGVCVARNRGVAESKGEYVAFLDADDVWLPEKIELQIDVFENDSTVSFSNTGAITIGTDGTQIGELSPGMTGRVTEGLLLFEQSVMVAPASTGFIRKETFLALNGFDARLSTAADWDFCFRASLLGPFGFVDAPVVKYRLHGNNMHGNISLMEKDMVLCYLKAFAANDPALARIRSRSYGNLYRVLAGSYFRAGKYVDFLRTAAKSVWYRPAGIGYFAAFPMRRLVSGLTKSDG